MVVNDRLEDAVDALAAIVQRELRPRPERGAVPEPHLAPCESAERRVGDGVRVLLKEQTANKRRKTRPVISPRIDKLLEHVDSDYASVVVAARRARQINSYYHNLGEGTFDEFPPPMVETRSKNYLTIALEEVAQGKLKYHYR